MRGSHEVHQMFTRYGWLTNPFSLIVDPDTFVGYEGQTRDIISFIESDERVALVLGPTGSGKTTLLKWIEKRYIRDPRKKVIYLAKPPKSIKEFRDIFLEVFPRSFFEKIFTRKPTIYSLYKYVNKKLGYKKLLLLVDEAHETSVEVLEWLRVFSDQIYKISLIVAGLPAFENLMKEKLKTFYERVSIKVELRALNKIDTYQLIKKRIEKVGGKGIYPFTEDAVDKIYELTGGFPREILKLCSKAVKYAYERNINKIDSSIIEMVFYGDNQGKDKSEVIGIVNSLTPKQREILRIISEKGPLGTSDVLEYLDLSIYKSRSHALRSVNNILKKLMELGLVLRKKDKNKYLYYASPKVEVLFVKS